MLNLLDFFSLQGWTRISKKFGLKEEEEAYCCFIFIHLFFLATFFVGWLLEKDQAAATYLAIVVGVPLLLVSVVVLIIGVYKAIKNWRNWKLRLLIITPLCLIAIIKVFDSISPEVWGVLIISYFFIMVLLPSWWLITSRRSRLDH